MNDPQIIREMLHQEQETGKSIAVLGLSDRPDRPSHYVSAYMQHRGYRILPVNPALDAVLGEKSYSSLHDLPTQPDIVNVFRAAAFLPGIVDDMLAAGLKNLWIQQGIIDLPSAQRAEQGGIHVVMDLCIMIEHRRLFNEGPSGRVYNGLT